VGEEDAQARDLRHASRRRAIRRQFLKAGPELSDKSSGFIDRHAAARAGARFRARPWQAVEIVLASAFGVTLLVLGGTLVRAWAIVVADAAASLIPLLRVDGAATAWTLALGLGRIVLAALPSVLLIRTLSPHRRIWLIPIVAMLVIVSSPLSLGACATTGRWILLAAASGLAAALTRFRFLRWLALLPFVLLWEVVPSHGLLTFSAVGTEDPAYRERLLAECARHDGTRPRNLTADVLMPYHGINSVDDDLVLLTGEGPNDGGMHGHTGGRRVGSWWLRRRDGVFEIEQPSNVSGNLWRGCVLDGTIWMARANSIFGAKRLPDGDRAYEKVFAVPLPSAEEDFGETACDPVGGRVYVTEGYSGGMWEVMPSGGEPRRHEIGGVVLLPKRRFDGQVVLTSTASLIVFSPSEDRVIQRLPAGLANVGFDVCEADGSVAIADLSGRVRVFKMDAAGAYRFAWGVSLFAPRRVAYSRDCSRLAATSADDHHVSIVDTSTHRVVDVFSAGPALREVAPTGPREFSVTDVCSMTTYRW
jgi:hypothetical protein